MEFQHILALATGIAMPLVLAWINATRGELKEHATKLAEVEQKVLQQRIDMQREMVGRHEIERLQTMIQHFITLAEQINRRTERLAQKLEGRNG